MKTLQKFARIENLKPILRLLISAPFSTTKKRWSFQKNRKFRFFLIRHSTKHSMSYRQKKLSRRLHRFTQIYTDKNNELPYANKVGQRSYLGTICIDSLQKSRCTCKRYLRGIVEMKHLIIRSMFWMEAMLF